MISSFLLQGLTTPPEIPKSDFQFMNKATVAAEAPVAGLSQPLAGTAGSEARGLIPSEKGYNKIINMQKQWAVCIFLGLMYNID